MATDSMNTKFSKGLATYSVEDLCRYLTEGDAEVYRAYMCGAVKVCEGVTLMQEEGCLTLGKAVRKSSLPSWWSWVKPYTVDSNGDALYDESKRGILKVDIWFYLYAYAAIVRAFEKLGYAVPERVWDSNGVWGFRPQDIEYLAYIAGCRVGAAKFRYLMDIRAKEYASSGSDGVGCRADGMGNSSVAITPKTFRGLSLEKMKWAMLAHKRYEFKGMGSALRRERSLPSEECKGDGYEVRIKEKVTLGRVSYVAGMVLLHREGMEKGKGGLNFALYAKWRTMPIEEQVMYLDASAAWSWMRQKGHEMFDLPKNIHEVHPSQLVYDKYGVLVDYRSEEALRHLPYDWRVELFGSMFDKERKHYARQDYNTLCYIDKATFDSLYGDGREYDMAWRTAVMAGYGFDVVKGSCEGYSTLWYKAYENGDDSRLQIWALDADMDVMNYDLRLRDGYELTGAFKRVTGGFHSEGYPVILRDGNAYITHDGFITSGALPALVSEPERELYAYVLDRNERSKHRSRRERGDASELEQETRTTAFMCFKYEGKWQEVSVSYYEGSDKEIVRKLRDMMNTRIAQLKSSEKAKKLADAMRIGEVSVPISLKMVHENTSFCWAGTLGWLKQATPFVYRLMLKYGSWEEAMRSEVYAIEYDVVTDVWRNYTSYCNIVAGLVAAREVEATV